MKINKIQIIRSAFRKIQKLSHQYFEDVEDILLNMYQDKLGDIKKLEGYDDLWRTRKGNTRVIWCEYKDGFLIISGGKRNNVYKQLLKNPNKSNPLPLNALLEIEDEKFHELPTYEYNPYIHTSWYSFVYGGYLKSPILTERQREILSELTTDSRRLKQEEVYSTLLQSPAGTGKTICASLLACEFYKLYNWNTFIVLPPNLVQDIESLSQVKAIKNNSNFFIGTLREFFELISPDKIKNSIASVEEELDAFRKEALRVNIISKKEEFTERELLLYRAFIDRETGYNHSIFPFYQENIELVRKLNQINLKNIRKNLAEKMTWLDSLRKIKQNAVNPFLESDTNLIVFDEAQDNLLSEYKILKNTLTKWKHDSKGNNCFILLAVGDKNQCVKPSDFDWGRLQLSKTYNLKYNYRNSEHIVRFANMFWQFAKERNKELVDELLPEPSKPEDSFEIGEPVRLIECSDEDEAKILLLELNKKMNVLSVNEKSIFSKLSNKLPIIVAKETLNNYSNLEYFTVNKAKGREFDSCVIFHLYQSQGNPSIEEANKWYTAATRARHRLLVICTSEEIQKLGRENLKNCNCYNAQDIDDSLEWISEWASSDSLLDDSEYIINVILDGLTKSPLEIYWDTYSAMKKSNASDEQISRMETEAIKILQSQSQNLIEQEFLTIDRIKSDIDRISLKCLLLRSLYYSWEAVNEAYKLGTIQNQKNEYNRLLYAIARDLETRNLHYEANRVRSIVEPNCLAKLPFGEEINSKDGSIISLLCHAAISKICNF